MLKFYIKILKILYKNAKILYKNTKNSLREQSRPQRPFFTSGSRSQTKRDRALALSLYNLDIFFSQLQRPQKRLNCLFIHIFLALGLSLRLAGG